MERTPLSLPEIGLIAGTRAAAGAGLALLLANRLNNDQRRAAGWSLLAVGALTTIPIVVQLFGSRGSRDSSGPPRMKSRGNLPRFMRGAVLTPSP